MWEWHLLQFWTTGSGPVWICPRRRSSGGHSPSTPQLLHNRPRWCQAWVTSWWWTVNQSYLGLEFGVDRSVFQAPGYRAPGVLLDIHQLTQAVDLLNIYGNIILNLAQTIRGVTFHRSDSWRRKSCPWTCWKGPSWSRMIGLKLQWSCSILSLMTACLLVPRDTWG